jgi:sulfite oxidase
MSETGREPSRRDVLRAGLAAGGLLIGRRLLGQSGATTPGTSGAMELVVRNARPLDAESPMRALASFNTATEQFFVRSHFGPPAQLPREWTLTIDGEVAKPVTLSLADVRKLGATTRPVTLECAGNGRGAFHLPKTSGVQWQHGAVSTADWTGVPLGVLLERAGLGASARHLWMEALDQAPLAVPKFLRSIPREVALGDAFVAYEMNGGAIPLLHGGPLRLIVPGWFGMASTKWLTSIHARGSESDNFFMAKGYRYPDQSPVQEMRVKSVIASPAEGERVRAGRLSVKGQAWTGASGAIRAVDVSTDEGRTWRSARLAERQHRGAWRSWEATIDLPAGSSTIMARATDSLGAVQPPAAPVNPGGYGNNSIHRVLVHATDA